MARFVPPGGFAGFAQQTPAVQASLRRIRGLGSTVRRSTRRARQLAPKKKRGKRRATSKKMVKGSAAAKRHMAKLRRMRK